MSAPASAATRRADQVAMLFAYRISDAAKFDEAYRDHLGWHRDHRDHLAWYGWYVIAGARTGMFVDGTFGSDFAAIDRRPDPKADAEHFLSGTAKYSTAVHYNAWTLWPEASTDLSLEKRAPTAMVDVLFVQPAPGKAKAFERALLSRRGRRDKPGLDWAWYRAAAGDRVPAYMVLIPRANWAALSGRPPTIGGLAAQAYKLSDTQAEEVDALVERVDAETWRYRPDLSLMPSDD